MLRVKISLPSLSLSLSVYGTPLSLFVLGAQTNLTVGRGADYEMGIDWLQGRGRMGKRGNGKRCIDCIHILPSGGNADFHNTVRRSRGWHYYMTLTL